MTNQRCKGARDLLPKDTESFRYIEDAFRHSCLSWGYQEVRTPTLEYLHLFTAAGTLTPKMLSRVYSFLDWDGWSGERVVLRPDGTIPVARLYIENLPREEITRLFYVTNVFAFEETGKDNRERWQCGVELLGNASATADVELLLLTIEILHNLNISGIEIKLSHAGVLKALLEELQLSPDEKTRLMTQVLDGNWQALIESASGDTNVSRLVSMLLDLRGKSSGFLENLKALPHISVDLKSELDNFAEVTSLLDAIDYSYQIDITSTRGFEYYTGLCFQILINEDKIVSGGRYDNLVPLIGGKDTPACGLALYIDPLMNLVQPDVQQKAKQLVLVKTETSMPNTIKTKLQLAQSLRDAGYVTELNFSSHHPNWRWTITVHEKPPLFMITDQIENQTREVFSIADAIDAIGGSA